MELNEKEIEQVARAYRDSIYGKPHENPASWEACRDHWIRDVRIFLAKLAEMGLEVVPIKKSPVNLGGTGRCG